MAAVEDGYPLFQKTADVFRHKTGLGQCARPDELAASNVYRHKAELGG